MNLINKKFISPHKKYLVLILCKIYYKTLMFFSNLELILPHILFFKNHMQIDYIQDYKQVEIKYNYALLFHLANITLIYTYITLKV